MRPTLTEVSQEIERLMGLEFLDKEENLILVLEYLKKNEFHLEHEDDFLDSLLQSKNFFTLEERLEFYVIEFMGESDRNDGLTFSDLGIEFNKAFEEIKQRAA